MFDECVYLFQLATYRIIFCKVRMHAICILTSCRASILPWSAEERTKDLLTGSTDSRRFIRIEATAFIDTNVSANYRQLYAQAMILIYHGERHWLDNMNEAVLYQSKQEFEQISPLVELYRCCFYFAGKEDGGECITPMKIFNYMQTNMLYKLVISKLMAFGRTFRKLDVP